jgi:hypothetical protein
MRRNLVRKIFIICTAVFFLSSCDKISEGNFDRNSDKSSKIIDIYSNSTIPANGGISTGRYTSVDGYNYVNVVIEFEQKTGNEEPVSLGVKFAHNKDGKLGARRFAILNDNVSGKVNPRMHRVTGRYSWHGSQQKISSYIARLPIMGPYIQVFPLNHHNESRQFSLSLYLVK